MKKFLYSSIVLVIIFISTINVNNNVQSNVYPNIFTANVEALASGESGSQPMDCYSTVERKNDGRPLHTLTYCGDCQPISCTNWSNQGRCMR